VHPRLEELTNSGSAWFGRAPRDWSAKKLKYCAPAVDMRIDGADATMPYIGLEHIESWTGKLIHYKGSTSTGIVNVYRKDDILFAKLRPYLAKVHHAEADGVCSTEVLVLRCSLELLPRFVFYSLASTPAIENINSSTYGAKMPRANWEFVGDQYQLIPPINEQRAIASFLDHETTRIDALIEKKRHLLELLEEKRLAVITCAVTRGLDPLVPMKDSGIDWLGQIPSHWVIAQLGKKIQLHRGVDITKDEQVEGPYPVVSSGGIGSYHDEYLCEGPGVLVGRKGTAGKLHYAEGPFWPHDTTLYVRHFYGNHPRFIYYKLLSMDLVSFDTGTANPTINRNLVHPTKVSWPPLKEQEAIASQLDTEEASLDRLRAKISEAIQRLQEYRSALIADAVTGKIDVAGLTQQEAAE
jgi:type I restriction enzyme, S subunit